MNIKSILFLSIILIALNAGAQSTGDFSISFTGNMEGIRITGYTGSARAITIPADIEGIPVKEIGNNAFANRNITSVVIPGSVTIIGENAFSGSRQLTSVIMHDNIVQIGDFAFRGTGITQIDLPSKITIINRGLFFECTSLTSIVIPEGVTIIGMDAFNTCSALTSITLPSTIISIRNSAFLNCGALTTVLIPDSVASIEFNGNPFVGCSRLSLVSQANLRRRGWDPNVRNVR